MKDYLRMLRFVKPHMAYLIAGVIFMFGSAVFGGVQLGMIIPIIDKIFNGTNIVLPDHLPQVILDLANYLNQQDRKELFIKVLISLPFLFIFKGICEYMQGWMMNVLSQKSVMVVRNKLFCKYQTLSLDFFTQKRQGELVSRITNDVGMIAHVLSYGLTDLFYQTFLLLINLVIALMLDAKLVAIILVILPMIGYIIWVIGRQLKKISAQTQEAIADLNSSLIEANQGVTIIKGFSREDHVAEKFVTTNKAYYKFLIKGVRRTLLMAPTTEILGVLAIVIILYMGGVKVLNGTISTGPFLTFIAALLTIMRPVKKLSAVYGIFQQSLAASKRIYDVLDLEATVVDKPNAQECCVPEKYIYFDDISFRYLKNEPDYILDSLNHKFEIGKTTALVGPTGCGKSTTINLIPRFYDPEKGRVLFDDQDIKETSIESLRRNIGIVTQDMILFNDTIRGNLQYGKLEATDEEILEACKKALALEFIENMPDGLDTTIGDRGVRLSGGQKQRLCIARAILKNPKILLLDEATSALDAESEFLVQQALDNLMQDRTVIVVAHRLSTIKNADCILVMDQGKIVQKGTHEELLTSSDLYSKLASYHFTA